MSKINIFLADDHTMFREGLRYIISNNPDYTVIGESGDGRNALLAIEKHQPDIAIIDISMPNMTGIEITRQLKKFNPDIKIIILSQHDNEEYVRQLLKYKVNAYVLKDNAGYDLLNAISEVNKGNIFFSPQITKRLINELQQQKIKTTNDNVFSILTNRELEILKLVAEGKTNNNIGSLLFISEKTVKNHRTNIMNKLNIHKTIDLVKYALKNGLIEP